MTPNDSPPPCLFFQKKNRDRRLNTGRSSFLFSKFSAGSFAQPKGCIIFATDWLLNEPLLPMRRDVFQAIADPTRREIIHVVARKPLNLNAVAETFDISRQAVSKHIKILTECGLIVVRQQGRERFCEARLDSLQEVSAWIEQYRTFWSNKLDALEKHLAEQ